jgi:hypothetical protein
MTEREIAILGVYLAGMSRNRVIKQLVEDGEAKELHGVIVLRDEVEEEAAKLAERAGFTRDPDGRLTYLHGAGS